jgi:cytochrome P450 family 135
MSASTLPPGPPLPRWLQTLAFVVRPMKFIELCRRRYGDVVTFGTSFDAPFVMVFDPESIKRLFQGPHDGLHAGEANRLLGAIVGDRSLLLLDGAEHLRQRKLMLPPFHGQRMRAYESVMREAADRAIDGWPVGEEFELLPSTQSIALDVIMRAVFGVEEGPFQDELKRRVRATLEPVSRRLGVLVLALSGGRFGSNRRLQAFQERRAALDEAIYAEIARRREADDLDEREDIFSMLLLARDENGEPMSDKELRDELVTLVVAGHETTATALAWAFDLLLHNERVLERVREGDERYLDAVVKETLRIRPVIPGIGRVVRGEPFELGGYPIPPGIEINPSIVTVHGRDDLYPQPREFRPERFLVDDPPDTYTWIPFGGGTRRCIGASFAVFEMRVVIARILERASLAAASPELDRVERRGITLVPRERVRVVQRVAPRAAMDVERAAAAITD